MTQPKTLDEISEEQWALYHWTEVTSPGDAQRRFIRGYQRTPEEAAKAYEEWSVWYGLRRVEENRRANDALQPVKVGQD